VVVSTLAPLTIETAESNVKVTQKQHKKDRNFHFTEELLSWRNLEGYQAQPGYTRCARAGGTFFRCLRKVPPAHLLSACVVQELGW
jgi:hypothetical protein